MRDRGEECDGYDLGQLPFRSPTTHCSPRCTLIYPRCGDGHVDDFSPVTFRGHKVGGEECDDANKDDTDGCMSDCRKCLVVNGNMRISESGRLCPGTFGMGDYGDPGALVIDRDNVQLDCSGDSFVGDGRGVGLLIYNVRNVEVKNCLFSGYSTGIEIANSQNVRFRNVTTCGNGRHDWDIRNSSRLSGTPKPALAAMARACSPWIQKRLAGDRGQARSPLDLATQGSRKSPAMQQQRRQGGRTSFAHGLSGNTPLARGRQQLSLPPSRNAGASQRHGVQAARYRTISLNGTYRSSGDQDVSVVSRATASTGDRLHDVLVLPLRDGQSRQVAYQPLRPSQRSQLRLKLAALDNSTSTQLSFTVRIRDQDGRQHTVLSKTLVGTSRVLDVRSALRRYKGKSITVEVAARRAGGSPAVIRVGVVHPMVTSALPAD